MEQRTAQVLQGRPEERGMREALCLQIAQERELRMVEGDRGALRVHQGASPSMRHLGRVRPARQACSRHLPADWARRAEAGTGAGRRQRKLHMRADDAAPLVRYARLRVRRLSGRRDAARPDVRQKGRPAHDKASASRGDRADVDNGLLPGRKPNESGFARTVSVR